MSVRVCTLCDHGEHFHFGHECAGLPKWECLCDGFCARELSSLEREVMHLEIGLRRGRVGDIEPLDEYGAIKEHLGRIMEKVSQQ